MLSRDEVKHLTGTANREAQVKHLEKIGFTYKLDVKNRPVLLWDHVKAQLGANMSRSKTTEPNLDGLRNLRNAKTIKQ